jgi:LysR family transcriptional activator of mexEF-oprN operon
MRHIDLNLLRVFDVLLAERSVTRTANRLSLTQSSISSALNRLRSAINDQLFVRGEGGLVPTSTALALAEPVRQALRDIDKALSACACFAPEQSEERVRLRADDGTLSRLLPHLLPIIEKEAPLLSLEVSTANGKNSFEHLRTGELDLLIATVDSGVPDSFRMTNLYSEKFYAVCRATSAKTMSLREFAEGDHIACNFSNAAIIDEALASLNLAREKGLLVESALLAALMAKSTNRICVLPEAAALVAADELGLAVFPLPIPVPERRIDMIWHERVHHNAVHRWLRGRITSIREPLLALRASKCEG